MKADSTTEVIAESEGATLTRTTTTTGRWPFRKIAVQCNCRCPFACMATFEPCEFKGLYDREGNPLHPGPHCATDTDGQPVDRWEGT